MEFFSLKKKRKKSIDFRYYVWNSAAYFAKKKRRYRVFACVYTYIGAYKSV